MAALDAAILFCEFQKMPVSSTGMMRLMKMGR